MEAIRYSMKPDYHDREMNEEIFPEEADGVIIFLNTERLSGRKDTLGDIFYDLLVHGNVELKNKEMEKRRKEVFTEENRISDIKFMYTEGISPEKIAKGTKLTLEKVKKILEIE